MAQAILVRVGVALHREIVRRAGLERMTLQGWALRLLRRECNVGETDRPLSATQRIARDWHIVGSEEPPVGARRGRRAAQGTRAGERGPAGVPSAQDGASGPERPGSAGKPEERADGGG